MALCSEPCRFHFLLQTLELLATQHGIPHTIHTSMSYRCSGSNTNNNGMPMLCTVLLALAGGHQR